MLEANQNVVGFRRSCFCFFFFFIQTRGSREKERGGQRKAAYSEQGFYRLWEALACGQCVAPRRTAVICAWKRSALCLPKCCTARRDLSTLSVRLLLLLLHSDTQRWEMRTPFFSKVGLHAAEPTQPACLQREGCLRHAALSEFPG